MNKFGNAYHIKELNPFEGGRQFGMYRFEDYVQQNAMIRHPHRHNCYTIIMVTGGSGAHYTDFTSYPLKTNDIFFITPGQILTFTDTGDMRGHIIFFTAEFFSMRYNNNVLLEFPFFHSYQTIPRTHLHPDMLQKILYLLQMLGEENQGNQAHREKVLRSYLNILLFELYRIYLPAGGKGDLTANQTVVRHFEHLIEEYFRQKKQVHEYAGLLCMSPNYLNSIVSRETGKSAGQLIRERVMIEAKRLLIHTDKTVAEVAYELGFNDNSYFTRFFKKYAVQTPEEFRGGYRMG